VTLVRGGGALWPTGGLEVGLGGAPCSLLADISFLMMLGIFVCIKSGAYDNDSFFLI